MHFYNFINEYLDKLTFSNKTKILIAIIASSMMMIGFLMFISLFAIKFDYETLYQKRTIPQVELEEIKDVYTVNIYDTFYDLKENNIDIDNADEVISLAKQIAHNRWKNYNQSIHKDIGGIPEFASNWLDFFLFRKSLPPKNYYQKGMTSKIEEKMIRINSQSSKIITNLRVGNDEKALTTINEIFLEINSINIYLSNLITSHLKEAIAEKNRNDTMFKTSIYMLILLIGLVFFLSIIISLILINHFKELHNSLETKVDIKTKELRLLNNSLEKRIRTEVRNSRKKDQIMFQQARLASLGEMLQNIAHQWRQPLGALTMIIQSFQSKFLSGKLTEEFIDSRVEDAGVLAKNMSDTLEDFRTFFDPNKSHKNFSIKKMIEKSIDLTKYQLEKEGITVSFSMPQDIYIYGFENELTHVLLNLINNSKDALSPLEITNKTILITVTETSVNVFIKVLDNAGGIQRDIIAKVFDPYFTTKHKSVGTGIGLYMSKQMVEKHMSGEIWCKNIQYKIDDSKLSKCAMFTIEIPKKIEADKEEI
ncbi:sensor histidine kinase [Sulfurospirillum arcachonense]|uniref:sensor histidine kinase n=1 Tax=Sulfurospirillum arcachonense TaxID=57666 RepID=UPI0004696E37|nr:HAMP domain-containing sensor histidine kinase [Sulfurospirillum arcachonense]